MKLNLGCGDDYRENCINIDIRKEVKPDIVSDLANISIKNNQADVLIARDVLEHFWDYESIINEWRRILSDNGILVIRVPDWETLTNLDYQREPISLEKHEKNVYGGHTNEYDVHHRLYTKKLLAERMRECGFGYSSMIIKRLNKRPLQWHLIAALSMNNQKPDDKMLNKVSFGNYEWYI